MPNVLFLSQGPVQAPTQRLVTRLLGLLLAMTICQTFPVSDDLGCLEEGFSDVFSQDQTRAVGFGEEDPRDELYSRHMQSKTVLSM